MVNDDTKILKSRVSGCRKKHAGHNADISCVSGFSRAKLEAGRNELGVQKLVCFEDLLSNLAVFF